MRNLGDSIFVPDGAPVSTALARTTHLAVGAHQDDLEIMAYHGIEHCYQRTDAWFGGVTVTDGRASARAGRFALVSDVEMVRLRHAEQCEAARKGCYSFQCQLGYPSAVVADAQAAVPLISELAELFAATRPHTLYLHNPADKHRTHIAVLQRCLSALRRLPRDARPERVFGCEVWRDLDWLSDDAKVALSLGRNLELERELIAIFRSQIEGGKDYVQGTIGRRRAHVTFFQPRNVDGASAITFAMDLTTLVHSDELSLHDWLKPHLDTFAAEVLREAAIT